MDLEILIERYPRLYHMAEKDSWPKIRQHGLLSTSALLDCHRINGERRIELERSKRPQKVTLASEHFDTVVLRDQKPLSDTKLQRCLQDGLTPADWYRLLNSKSFFWVDTDRLSTLLNAGSYVDEEHDVLTIRTEPLVRQYFDRITLSHINSGSTSPYGTSRGLSTFVSIQDYPVKRNGLPKKEVAELVVDYAVPNIADYVESVRRMQGDTVLEMVFQA